MQLSYILIGIMLLTLGRKLFWLFVGLAGFVAGLQTAQLHFMAESTWVLLIVGSVCGLIGVLLALFFQNLAIGIGGFAAGSSIAVQLTVMLGFSATAWVTLGGGIIGLILAYLVFDWALIVLSSLIGSVLIVVYATVPVQISAWLFIGLSLAGIVFQKLLSHPRGSTWQGSDRRA